MSALSPQLHFYDLSPRVTAFSTTRHGGCSRGNYHTFNINRYCGDDEHDLARNREALCWQLAIDPQALVMPHQTHQTTIRQIDRPFMQLGDGERQTLLEGVDALTTDLPQVCIGVSTADCIPLLLFDPDHDAACAVHAGWRGTVSRIAERAVATMAQAYGTRPERLLAMVGPGISQAHFEVGDEVYEQFALAGFDMAAIARRLPAEGFPIGKWHIDLPLCNALQLCSQGVDRKHIKQSGICTYAQAADFFSARRLGTASGRIFTGIIINAKK